MGFGVSNRLRRDAREIFQGALSECSPARLIASQLQFEAGVLLGPDFKIALKPKEKVLLLATGKAAGTMTGALLNLLPASAVEGLAILPPRARPVAAPVRTLRGTHPLPGPASFRSGSLLLKKIRSAGPGSVVIHLISGGTSALSAAPLPGLLSRSEKRLLHRLLVGSSLGIREINIVRKHFSAIKGGRLAAAAPGALQVSLMLSDTPVDCPEAVGSGPTLPDPSTWLDCLEILNSTGLILELPASLRRRLSRGRWPETPKPRDPCFRKSIFRVVADSRTLVESAARQARRLGYATRILPGSVEGTPDGFLERILRHRDRWTGHDGPRCILAAGEVRAVPKGEGRGGRAQDLALAAALRLAGDTDSAFLAAGSDGKDGNSPAAGAISDGRTVSRARRHGLDPIRLRDGSDSYRLFRELGDCLITGPTGNNLRDLYLLIDRGKSDRNQRARS